MAVGDITASAAVICNGPTAAVAAVEALNLAATTDFIFVLPIEGRNNQYAVFKAERAAS